MEAIPTWYASIEKPSWTPPNAVFGPVWTTLYVMIGIAGWLVSRQPERKLLTIWIAQLALNFIWTPLFFGAHQVGWALADISVMWSSSAGSSWRPEACAHCRILISSVFCLGELCGIAELRCLNSD
jgi:tryptophan-rich sensory protein